MQPFHTPFMEFSSLTIAAASQKLRSKEVKPSELVAAAIARIEALDKTLNAVVYRNFERALEKAKKLDAETPGPSELWGVPYLAKDVYCEAGVPTTACSNILRDPVYVPPFDSTTTLRLNVAGAVSVGKANTDEFTMGASTETSCYGPTRNPWDTSRVAGGSSGGSAAGVAAGYCPFALGTDTGGSIRLPASFCGCVGLRTTYGRTSRYGVMSMASSLDTIGPFARTVEDIAIVLRAIAGKDIRDATTADKPVPDYRAALAKGVNGMKIGMPKEYFIDGMLPEVEKSVRAAADVLRSLGAEIVDISLPHTKYGVATYYVITPCEVSSNMARYDGIRFGHTEEGTNSLTEYYERVRSRGFGPEVKRRIMVGTYALSSGYYDAYYRKAQVARARMKQDFEEAFKTVDAVISPTSPGVAFGVGAHADDPLAMYLEDVFMCPQPMAGIPALSVPCGFAERDGKQLPIGLQIMGPQWGEETVLRVGHAYEEVSGLRGKMARM